ncbi:MAG: c-type cytochrome [Proteobacteria bacterium]|nr:c-type cytochrome [Pseudomonadota bacterium]
MFQSRVACFCVLISLAGLTDFEPVFADSLGASKIKKSTKELESSKEKKILIDMWTSRDGGKKRENIREEVDIGGLYFDGLDAYDIQYEQTEKFKGIKLRDLISQYKPIPPGFDFVLLHSKQGMIIPVEIGALRSDTEVFIALAIFDPKKKAWSTDFKASVYSQPEQAEKVSLTFHGNKMVVGKKWRHTDFAITPWRFFDSLAGIEFISSADHYKALEPKDKAAEIAGRSVYMRRCQYCHGIGEFGARFAPNFATLFPDKKDAAVNLIMNKVLTSESELRLPASKPQRMPKQSDFTKGDARALVNWVQSVK